MEFEWTSIVELAAALVALVVAGGGASAVYDRIKGALGLTGRGAAVGFFVFSAALVLIGGIAAGQILPETFTDPLGLMAMIITAWLSGDKWHETKS